MLGDNYPVGMNVCDTNGLAGNCGPDCPGMLDYDECSFSADFPIYKMVVEEYDADVSSSVPSNPIAGQYWFNGEENQLSMWDGKSWVRVPVLGEDASEDESAYDRAMKIFD